MMPLLITAYVFIILIFIIFLIWIKTYYSLKQTLRELRLQDTECLAVSPEDVRQENNSCPLQDLTAKLEQNTLSCSQPKRGSLRSLWGSPQMVSQFNKADITLNQLIKAGKEGIFYEGKMMHGTIKGHARFTCKISKNNNQKQIEKEISIMQKLGTHKNLLQLVDWDISEIPYMLIMEYVNQGNLLHFLRVNKDDLHQDKELQHRFTIVAYHIAHAMNHLRSKMVVHCDLALRNIMVHSFPHDVKVAEFSLAKDLTSRHSRYQKTSRKRVPFRWYPPEYFRNKTYGFKGDVWAFGILIWEMLTFGVSVPYPHLNTSEDVERYVCAGHRNALPEECRAEMIQMMKDCWQDLCSLRPSFMDIVRVLENILENDCDYVNIEGTDLTASVDTGN
ncbi:tyrosine kinase receptor Cad96Ca-like [Brachyhypopomus gauderio]|uniref:tyrosine kinase receptor Cad96Ca-like n=1 Tax=Brachyhypopomus gauderio TaxID=698409 RepID=UPI0040427D66